jgi:hypothetical protein
MIDIFKKNRVYNNILLKIEITYTKKKVCPIYFSIFLSKKEERKIEK